MTDSNSQAIAVRQSTPVTNIQPMLDTAKFEHFQRAASALMHSSILNESVRGNSPQQCFSNLMLVFDLSDRWKLPALSIAQGIAIVHNKVVYEGKLIAAMLDASLGVRLHYFWKGERGALDYRIYVSDSPWDELTDDQIEALAPGVQMRGRRIIDGSVGDWRTFQKDQRTPNPAWTGAATQNQLAYRGAREWARRYEPGQMLGVYGDDEIDQLTIQMQARDVTPQAPGLTGGFTKPVAEGDTGVGTSKVQEATDAIDLAEQVEKTAEQIDAAKNGPETGQEAEVEAEAPKGKGKAKAAPSGEESKPAVDPKRQAVLDERKAALDTAVQMGREAQTMAEWGNNDLEGLLKTCKTDEQRTYVENGWKHGRQNLEAELENAHAAGVAGTPIQRPEWFSDGDKSAERRWGLIHDAWKAGAEQGTADAKADAATDETDAVETDVEGEDEIPAAEHDPDDAHDRYPRHFDKPTTEILDAIAEAEPELVEQVVEDHGGDADDFPGDKAPDAIEAWEKGLAALSDWKSIKASMNALAKTSAWDTATPERIANVRRLAWLREAELIEAGQDRMDFITDLTAFRCWIETTDDRDAIDGNWQTLVRQPIYSNLSQEQRGSLQAAVLKRVEQIEAAAKGE